MLEYRIGDKSGGKSPRVNYSEAVSACQTLAHGYPGYPYTLAMARTKEEAKTLEQFLNDTKAKGNVDELVFWIGLSRKPGETNFKVCICYSHS